MNLRKRIEKLEEKTPTSRDIADLKAWLETAENLEDFLEKLGKLRPPITHREFVDVMELCGDDPQ